jgi:hypothetical protein
MNAIDDCRRDVDGHPTFVAIREEESFGSHVALTGPSHCLLYLACVPPDGE